MGKYLLYAIGEIVLVVIGILIALSINNWNEDRKFKQKERHALSEIVSDLDNHIIKLEAMLVDSNYRITRNVKSLEYVIEHLNNRRPYHDSLNTHFSNTNAYVDPDFKISGYQALSSMGLDVVLDDELRSKIGEYFTVTHAELKGLYNELRDDFYNYMLDYMRKDFLTVDDGTDLLKPRDYGELLNKTEYVQSLYVYKSIYIQYVNGAENSLKEARTLRRAILDYLD